MTEDFLNRKLQERKQQNAYRQLQLQTGKIDFCSNDYLGIVKNKLLESPFAGTELPHGSTGSRLLAGNYSLIEEVEKEIAIFHNSEAGLIFNSGYDANTGLLSSVPQRGDTILYDQLCHASIRDGIRLSFARSISFDHNNIDDLAKKITQSTGTIFVVTESVFSMDGDIAPLHYLLSVCNEHNAHLIIDEAHATGIVGNRGQGVIQMLDLQSKCFARIHTFGKAVGCHGAIVLGSSTLRNYLVNFCRQFIYSTALPPVSIQAVRLAYQIFPRLTEERAVLSRLLAKFRSASIGFEKLESETAIQAIVIPGNKAVKQVAARLQNKNLDIRPILYPTVPKGRERLRVVLHSFNTEDELELLLMSL